MIPDQLILLTSTSFAKPRSHIGPRTPGRGRAWGATALSPPAAPVRPQADRRRRAAAARAGAASAPAAPRCAPPTAARRHRLPLPRRWGNRRRRLFWERRPALGIPWLPGGLVALRGPRGGRRAPPARLTPQATDRSASALGARGERPPPGRHRTAALRRAVQTSPRTPSAAAPRAHNAGIWARCSALNAAGPPGRGRARSASTPCSP